MDFEYEVTIDVPREYAFARFTDINQISATLPANIVLRSEKGSNDLSEGSVWVVKAQRSGRNFVIRNVVTKNVPPEALEFESSSNRIESTVKIAFEALGPEQCKIIADFDIQPKGLLGRILIQSLKASKKRVFSSMDSGSKRLKATMERDYQAQKG